MDEFFKRSILYDLYGGMLSEKEQVVYEYHIIEDLSFNEIGEELKISRQAAYDLFKNADKRLKEIDNKLKLSVKFKEIENYALSIKKSAGKNQKIIKLSNKILCKVKEGGKN